ncbi:MAG: beta-N-acetylhexosaminidase [Cyclobacteriaceae bacterium]|nr:beta-N-acetylhexosaminidase [Cyclobacteriaceae bacterium]
MRLKLYQLLILSTNNILLLLGIVSIPLLLTNCSTKNDSNKEDLALEVKITPVPAKLLYKRGYFQLDKGTRILMNLSDIKSKEIGAYFLNELKLKTKYKLKIADRFTTSKLNSSIEIITDQSGLTKKEAFKIEIKRDKIKIYASDNKGLYHAVNTVLELLNKTYGAKWRAPRLIIDDYPATIFRALYISSDSLEVNKNLLLELLQKNRINHLVIEDTSNFAQTNYIAVINPANLKLDENRYISGSIKDFYSTNSTKNDTLVFAINNFQLHPDSLALIGEAMWSKPDKRNYTRFMKRLNNIN